MKRISVIALVLAFAVTVVPGVMAQQGPKVYPPDSVVYGRTYGDWMAAWNQWSFSLPTIIHPLFTDGDCSVGQTGPVWFLGGTFVGSGTRVRHCVIPYGKALFFPVIDWEDSTIEEALVEHPGDPVYQQIAGLRLFVETGLKGVSNLFCEVDHQPVPHFPNKFRVQSPVFGMTMPEDNVFTRVYGTTFNAGTYFPSIDDGWDVMVAPMTPGEHVIHFGSSWNDITYYITVVK